MGCKCPWIRWIIIYTHHSDRAVILISWANFDPEEYALGEPSRGKYHKYPENSLLRSSSFRFAVLFLRTAYYAAPLGVSIKKGHTTYQVEMTKYLVAKMYMPCDRTVKLICIYQKRPNEQSVFNMRNSTGLCYQLSLLSISAVPTIL